MKQDKQNIRIFFLISIGLLIYFLMTSWSNEHFGTAESPANLEKFNGNEHPKAAKSKNNLDELPSMEANKQQRKLFNQASEEIAYQENLIDVSTSKIKVKIDPKGGDIVYLELTDYPESKGFPEKGVALIDIHDDSKVLKAQSGLLNPMGPDSREHGRATYESANSSYTLTENEESLNVDLFYVTSSDTHITKRFIFYQDSYVIKVQYIIDNKGSKIYHGSLYGQLKRKPRQDSSSLLNAMRTYTGAAFSTDESRYIKIPFDDMSKKPFRRQTPGGWAAMVEHYFTTAWIPSAEIKNYYQSDVLPNNTFGVSFFSPEIAVDPNESVVIEAQLFSGPEITDMLKEISPGLELTVDFGALWWLCQPIFWLMKQIYMLCANWGVSIILTTLVIKVLFYKFSASSYRSMGNMRKLQPRIEQLKERYGDDKQGFGQAVMQLYKTERVNPLGGCLPILIQIPVFISLYYVLLESVELRQAPFGFWLQDLSDKDPFYVLPILMGISMLAQQKMNPAPPDPIQAKVMMFMPIVFTVLFLNFPSGLVLYWLVNNVISILQQWYIVRSIDVEGTSKKEKSKKKK